MTHKTFRELTAYETEKRKKVREKVDGILAELTAEEAYILLAHVSHALFLSCQKVEELNIVKTNQTENVEESF